MNSPSAMAAQIVIAVHSFDRPIRRAVQSVLNSGPNYGVIVVAHGISGDKLDLPKDARITVIECAEGLGRPGVPFNRGIAQVEAPLLGIMGSDDWFEKDALDCLVKHQKEDQADGVIAPLRHYPKMRNEPNPLTVRRKNLRASRDRLFYRTAPLGLYRSEIMQHPQYAFFEDAPTGEDLLVGTRLWTSGLSISCYPNDPRYVVGDDAPLRVTETRRPVSETLLGMRQLLTSDHVKSLTLADRNALATKLLRANILSWARNSLAEEWSVEEWDSFRTVTREIIQMGPGSLRYLSIRDARVLKEVLNQNDPKLLKDCLAANNSGVHEKVFSASFFDNLNRESNLRRSLAQMATRATFSSR